MKLRVQLLWINLASLMLLIGALFFCYRQMLLTWKPMQWLTVFAVIAGGLSATAYWFMTQPIIRSIQRLIRVTEKMADRRFPLDGIKETGPEEIRLLARSFHEMGQRLEASFQQLEQSAPAGNWWPTFPTTCAPRLPPSNHTSKPCRTGCWKETTQQYLTTIRLETKRLSAMIDDLFELSVLEAGQQAFQPVPTYLDQVLIQVLDSHALILREKSLKLDIHVDDDLPPIPMMPQKITRVISNLLQNAIRHSPPGGTIGLEARWLRQEGEAEIRVSDEGEGIPEEMRDRVFERFYRVDPSRNRESGGAGLGLAIACSLVELHGGSIGVRARNDGKTGSEFWFRLPRDVCKTQAK